MCVNVQIRPETVALKREAIPDAAIPDCTMPAIRICREFV